MRKLWLLAGCSLALWGCKAAPESSSSKFEVGDYVVYKYSGSYRHEPILLTEKVLSKTEGNKLEILVEWKSGNETRAWKQYVTDTPYNRSNNIVDRLVKIDGTNEIELPNKDNQDLYKLYEGTYLMTQRVPHLIREEKKSMQAGPGSYLCRIRTYETKALGKRVEMTVADSEEFKWTNVSSCYTELKSGPNPYNYQRNDLKPAVPPRSLSDKPKEPEELLYSVEVVEYGNKK